MSRSSSVSRCTCRELQLHDKSDIPEPLAAAASWRLASTWPSLDSRHQVTWSGRAQCSGARAVGRLTFVALLLTQKTHKQTTRISI